MSDDERTDSTDTSPHPHQKLPTSVKRMADDFGLDVGSLESFNFEDVLKKGPGSFLFLTRISQVYSQNTTLEHEILDLKAKITKLETDKKEAEARAVALEKTVIKLENENDFLSTKGQNSVLGTVIFSLGSICIGIAGGLINAKQYLPGAAAGLIGVGLSVLAGFLVIRRSKKGGQ
jgi:hypothetical protein